MIRLVFSEGQPWWKRYGEWIRQGGQEEVWREAWNGSGPLSLRGGKRKRAGEDSWRRTSCVFPGSSLVFEQPRRRLWMLVRCLRSKGRHRFCHLATE